MLPFITPKSAGKSFWALTTGHVHVRLAQHQAAEYGRIEDFARAFTFF